MVISKYSEIQIHPDHYSRPNSSKRAHSNIPALIATAHRAQVPKTSGNPVSTMAHVPVSEKPTPSLSSPTTSNPSSKSNLLP